MVVKSSGTGMVLCGEEVERGRRRGWEEPVVPRSKEEKLVGESLERFECNSPSTGPVGM